MDGDPHGAAWPVSIACCVAAAARRHRAAPDAHSGAADGRRAHRPRPARRSGDLRSVRRRDDRLAARRRSSSSHRSDPGCSTSAATGPSARRPSPRRSGRCRRSRWCRSSCPTPSAGPSTSPCPRTKCSVGSRFSTRVRASLWVGRRRRADRGHRPGGAHAGRGRRAARPAALVVLIPVADTGHAAQSGNHDTAVDMMIIHLVGVSVWVGGLIAFLGLARQRVRAPAADRAPVLHDRAVRVRRGGAIGAGQRVGAARVGAGPVADRLRPAGAASRRCCWSRWGSAAGCTAAARCPR